ncbi:MAG: hypothetical protein NZ960_05165 [Candidatus Kapabacteria bacterium]|nr:hypothetical protein [Candidatus Kapabacteria bacterium]MDW8012602.1 hypothetical protein [Bacteroidota bacterium]
MELSFRFARGGFAPPSGRPFPTSSRTSADSRYIWQLADGGYGILYQVHAPELGKWDLGS